MSFEFYIPFIKNSCPYYHFLKNNTFDDIDNVVKLRFCESFCFLVKNCKIYEKRINRERLNLQIPTWLDGYGAP